MNPKERFLNCMSYSSVDHFPYRPQGFWGATKKRWLEEGLPSNCSIQDYFGFEKWVYTPIDVTLQPKFEREVRERTSEWHIVRSEKGIIQKEFIANAELSMPEWIEFPVKDRQDFLELKKRYLPVLEERTPSDWISLVEKYNSSNEVVGIDVFNGLYMTLREWLGPEGLLYAFIDEEELIEEMLDFYVEYLYRIFEQVLPMLKVDYISFSEDMAYNSGPFISPAMFDRFFKAHYTRLAALFKKHGVDYFVIDSDGYLEPLIPSLLESGVCGIHPNECASGMDVVELRKKYGRDLRLWCGIDKRVLTQDKKAIDQELEAKVPYLLNSGGYIPQIDHSVPPNVSFENFCYYWERLKAIGERG